MVSFGKGGIALLMAVIGLAACGGGAPPNDVSAGVGFQDYRAYQARRATLLGEAHPPQATVVPPTAPQIARLSTPPPAPEAPPAPSAVARAAEPAPPVPTPPPAASAPRDVASLAAAAIAAAEAPPPAPTPQEPVTLASAPLPQPAPAPTNPGISDEQDFDAVAGRETIESDAERRARMQADRVVIQPTAVPERPGGLGPNIIDYALSTSHPVGERMHPRRPILESRHRRNCLAFRAPDLAQEWFLQNGGPARDRQGLDPDGDGYACAWDPTLYRAAAAAARN